MFAQQIGLDMKEKDVEDLVETVEVTDEIDEEQQIRDEVRILVCFLFSSHLDAYISLKD
jgi:hypothetical protein